MLGAAMAKHESFNYCPDSEIYWKQGQSSEKDFIFTTTSFVQVAFIDRIHEEMQKDEHLLICCKKFSTACSGRYCMREGGGSGKGYLWLFHRPGAEVVYEWYTSRAAECLKPMLDGFTGTVQSDGYAAYTSYAENKPIELAACWAHVRRKFHNALEECPGQAGWVLAQIGLMYRAERRLRGKGAALRQAVRAAETGMVLARLERMLKLKLEQHRPTSAMGTAINYTLSLWPQLLRFRDNGHVEIDNNLIENAVRPTALGKKNWMFIGHPEAGQRSAIIYTLLESCKRHGINPQEYLRDLLSRLPSMTNQQTRSLTPANWLKERRKSKAA